PAPAATPIPKVAPTAQPLGVQKKQDTRVVAGLIQPTNAQERAKQVESEIRNGKTNNPFAGLPPALPQPTTSVPKTVPTVAELPKTNTPGTGTQPARPTSSKTNSPVAMGPLIPPMSLNESPTLPKAQDAPLGANVPPALPSAPSTASASAVEVTGVVVVGRSPQAIVIVPGDPGSRYVGVGQRISGGKVLVKRIEMTSGADPIVILEENGVEVARGVGEKSAAPAKQANNPTNQLQAYKPFKPTL
ncbi:MAG: hypothetical protein DCF22_11725, partial [Leptolyngbya sp.]